jgi:ABC-type antimicrobial peptide transport system permease subunit
MALGAQPVALLKEVVQGGILPVVGGILAGIVASIVLAGALASFLFGVEPTDPASFALAGLVLLGAGALAAAIPGYHASRTDPVEALRGE